MECNNGFETLLSSLIFYRLDRSRWRFFLKAKRTKSSDLKVEKPAFLVCYLWGSMELLGCFFTLVKGKSSNFRLLAHSMFQGLELRDWMNSHSMEIKCHFLPAKHHVGNGFLYTMCCFCCEFVFAVLTVYSEVCDSGQQKIEQLVSSYVWSFRNCCWRLSRPWCFKRNTAERRASILSTFYNVSFVLMKSM